MPDTRFNSMVAMQARSILEDNYDLIVRLVSMGQKFENWLQLEVFKSLLSNLPTIEIERLYPDSNQRCDFWFKSDDGTQNWLELKLCVTNYCRRFRTNQSTRPITQHVDDVIRDVEKLRRISEVHSRNVLLIAYPIPDTEGQHRQWTDHLKKIESHVRSLSLEFSFSLTRKKETANILGYELAV